MGKYTGQIEWSGYSRGTMVVEVEADSEEEAIDRIKNYDWDYEVQRDTVRDDTEKFPDEVCNVQRSGA